jgi:antitoxin component of MazEF toxin-antitoxin module
MPLIRSIIDLGNSKAVTIPKSWIDNYEKESGAKITEIAMEVNGVIIIRPVLQNYRVGASCQK